MTEDFVPMIVGNIKEPTKWFTEGTKVYILYITGIPDRCMVIGKARGSKGKRQKIWIPSKYIVNLRAQNIYNPHIIEQFIGYHGRNLGKAINDLGE